MQPFKSVASKSLRADEEGQNISRRPSGCGPQRDLPPASTAELHSPSHDFWGLSGRTTGGLGGTLAAKEVG